MEPTTLEKTSLEAHVDLCAVRYQQLDQRLTILEQKVDKIQSDITAAQQSLKTTIITTGGTIVTSCIAVIVTILMQ